MKKIAVLTSGGDAPGMNAALRAVVRVAAEQGVEVVGVQEGYDGLIAGRLIPLTRRLHDRALGPVDQVDQSAAWGGTLLGSTRSERFRTEDGRKEAAAHLSGTDGLVVIGGNGSLTGAHLLAKECGIKVVGIPASIDNDIGCTSTAIGVDTALNTIVEACDRISDTARAHRRIFVVEVMGRQCGYLAMASAVAAGADAVLFREQGRRPDELAEAAAQVVHRAFAPDRHKRRVLIIQSEGVALGATEMVAKLKSKLGDDMPGVEVRGIVLGHLVRGGKPSFLDRMVGARFGLAAFQALLAGADDTMVAWQSTTPGGHQTQDPSIQLFPLTTMLKETESLLDGSSPVTQRRVKMMSAIEGVLAL